MVILEHINRKLATGAKDLLKSFKKGCAKRIFEYVDPKEIYFLDSPSRDSALQQMVDGLKNSGKLQESETFFQAILEREKIVSTGIGMGVAVPHAKLKSFDNFFIAIGIQKSKGIEWNSLDKVPVRIIFMIGGPEDQQKEYLQILSCLTHAIKNDQIRKELLTTETAEEIQEILQKSTQ